MIISLNRFNLTGAWLFASPRPPAKLRRGADRGPGLSAKGLDAVSHLDVTAGDTTVTRVLV